MNFPKESKGLYSWATLTPESTMSVIDATHKYFEGLDQSNPTDYHVTLLYAKLQKPNLYLPRTLTNIQCTIDRLVTWQDHKDRTILVALVDSEALHQNMILLNKLGYKHSYSDYNPHVTLGRYEHRAKVDMAIHVPITLNPRIYYAPIF